ncbi:MAG: hypothetical protein ACK5M4_00235 [Pseudorhodobacter sp.]
MTALKKYLKLESRGLWRDIADGKRREVIVNLGDSSLVLSDPRQDTPLSHWSLPAVIRLNPGERPAIFGPGSPEGETLELEDPDMIAALETVQSALKAARPHPGRLRNTMLAALSAGIVILGLVYLPPALVERTASVLPDTKRKEIGRMALLDLSRLTGQRCAGPRGTEVLAELAAKLATPPPDLVVIREGVTLARNLPGPVIVLSQDLLAEQDGPDLLAGVALAETIAAERDDPMLPLLRYAGVTATLRLLTTGTLPANSLGGYAETLLETPQARPPEQILLPRFEAAGISTRPYAQAIDPGGGNVQALIEADPFANVTPPALMSDEDWVRLQDICAN